MHLENEIAQAEKQVAALRDLQSKQMKSLMVPCAKCGQGNTVGKMIVREHAFYVEPYSCTGGDYWTTGSNPIKSFVCEHCQTTNRLFGSSDSSVYHLLKPWLKHETVNGENGGFWVNTNI